jgi:hypothetical protein
VTSDRRQTHIFGQDLPFKEKKKNNQQTNIIFAGSKLIFLVVNAHGVFPQAAYLTGSILTFTSSVFYLIQF